MGMLTGAGARVLLVGTGAHTAGSQLPDLPAVPATITELASTVVARCGARPEQVRTLLDPASPLVFGRELTAAAAQAEDVLLVCYLGHGLLDAHGQLYLATQATDHLRDGLGYTALPYAALREELASSRARSVIVLLDCCFSGRANGSPYPADLDGFATTRSPGGYLLASAAPEELALAPIGERHTAFTGELIRLLRDGDPAGPRELTLDHLYRCLDRALPEQGRPRPRRYVAGRTGELVVAPNPAFAPPVLSRPRPREQAPTRADAACPYRGLKGYDVADARYFFGREELTARLVTLLAQQLPGAGMLIVIGPSGSGKSSLLRAGLIPALDAGLPATPGSRAWPRVVLTPGAHPIAALASRLAPLAGAPADTLSARLAADPAELSTVAGAVLSRHDRGAGRLVLVVDQFEEIFTACSDTRQRRAFLDALSTAAASTALVVLGLRADFYAQCAAEPPLVEALQRSQLIVTPMSTGELHAAIEKPAAQAGLALEPGLVTLILRDLRTSDNTEHASGNGGLPLLSHALFETWQQRDGDLLTLAGYEATGGIWEAVTRSAEDRYAALTATERETAQLVLLRMVRLGEGGTEDTTRRVRLADLPGTEATTRVLTTFADARLITLSADTVEIAHEALLRAWPRLRQWIDTDRAANLIRQELHEAAAGWDRDGRDPTLLYRGSRLDAARTWVASTSNQDAPSPAASAFLAASTRQERGAVRLRRAVLVVLSVLALVASGAAVFAFQQSGTAQRERDNAIFNQITAQADRLRGTDVSLAAQLSLTAYRIRSTPDLNTALVSMGNAALSTPLTGHANFVTSVAFSPDGRTLASGSVDSTVRLWDVTDPARPVPLGLPMIDHTDAVSAVAFSPDGHTLASGSEDWTVRLWDVTDPARPTLLGAPLTDHTDVVRSVVFSPDGRMVASGGDDNTVRLWDLADPARPASLTGHTNGVRSVVFSPDGRMVASGSDDNTVRLWDLADPARPASLTGHTNGVRSVAFGPDGRILASASRDRHVRLWDLADPARPVPLGAPLTGHTNSIYSVVFSPDGRILASGGPDRQVRLWNLTDPARPMPLGQPLTGHTNFVFAVVFSPDGRTLVSGSFDSAVRLWDVTDPAHPTALGQPLTGHTDFVNSVVFSPDGRTLATASTDRTVRLWELDVDQAIQRICATTRNTLTPVTWEQHVSPGLPYRPLCP